MSKVRDAIAKAKQARGRPPEVEAPLSLGRVSAPTAEADSTSDAPPAGMQAPTRARFQQQRQVYVDQPALRRAGLLGSESQERRLAEEYRHIKRPLLKNAAGRTGVEMPHANLIMVTSAVPNEGKTFTCINLALSIAREKDWDVVLIDGDVAKRHVTTLFGLEEEPGLLDLLRDADMSIERCIVPTDVPGLSIMPAGAGDEESAELLASLRMETIAQSLSEGKPRPIVLFDSSPLLVSTEAAVLASHMGQTVVVVKAGHTTHQQVQHAVDKLDPDKAVTLILNQAETGETLAYGAYYPTYGSGARPYGRTRGPQDDIDD